MKVTTTIILICATVVLCHGHVKHQHQRAHHRTLAFRSQIPQGLELFLNATSGLVGLLNTTTQVAVIFDLSTSSVVIFNGLGGDAVAVDGHSHTVLKLDNAWSDRTWNFAQYFRSLTSLREVTGSGKAVQKSEVEPELSRLAAELGVESNALENLVGASATLHQEGGVLRLLIGQDHFKVKGSLLRTITVLKGIGDLFAAKSQDLEQLGKSGNRLDFPSIFNAPNGLQAFLRILQSLGPVNMAPMMANPLSNIDTALHIIVELGGNDSDDGIDNILKIVYNIAGLITGHGCLDCLIEALIDAGQNGGVEIKGADTTPVVDDLLKLAESQNSLFQSGGIFNVIIRFLRDLNSNNLFLNDINISELLQVLSKGDYKGAVDMIVRFFMHLNNILNPTKSIPRFFGYLLTALNGTRGLNLLPQFLPGVQPDQLQQLQGINITNILQNQNVVSNVPILGQIFKQFSGSVGSASNGNLNFTNLLSQAGEGMAPLSTFGRFFGPGLFQPWQNFANLNPFQSLLQGGGNLPILGGANVTNVLINNSVPCINTTENAGASLPVNLTIFEESTTTEIVTTEQNLFKKRNHGRKGSKRHHEKHHNKHLKHNNNHEKKHNEKAHGQQ